MSILRTRRSRESAVVTPLSRFGIENRGVVAEAVGDTGRVWRIRIISAGAGSSAYYPAEVLERDGKRAFPIGTKSYFNHPSSEERWSRPERDAEKICGKQISEAEYDATDQSLYADYEFTRAAAPTIEDLHDVLGMSIYAMTEYTPGETIGEYTGDIVTRLLEDRENSVDVVTVAGANGAVIKKVSESYTAFVSKGTSESGASNTPSNEGTKLDKELKDALDGLAPAIVAALTEALKPVAPKVEGIDLAAEYKLAAEADLPKEARDVVFLAIESGTPAADAIASQTALVATLTESISKKAEAAADIASGRVLESGAGKNDDFTVDRWTA